MISPARSPDGPPRQGRRSRREDRLILTQQSQPSLGIRNYGGQWLVEFVSQIGGQFDCQTEAGHLGQFDLLPAQLILGQPVGGDVLSQPAIR